ncbi:MAG: hypothetical protein IPG17_11605 [Sandaracinaceae bacterium]|jgi:hypothetical protein|nr:hypothetical protein [Sandaracinaceae bacterium]MBP7685640.1 hypothetical protein [Deltaproteobacteria bacterium]MBK6809271.1 hypothetical protein [Sandaracinaceae bacterium]MBK7151384.1 hypothetical protein [Sandaracinaceae bacterium]MBK8407712.1 hypothetical protein [Sandaracinaceae bacterium]
MSEWIRSAQELKEFMSYMLAYAPDFPWEDYLEDDQQMTLRRAFDELAAAVVFLPESMLEKTRTRIAERLSAAHAAFEAGDVKSGCRIIQQLETEWFGGPT